MKRFAITGNRQSKVASEIKKSVASYFQEFSSQFQGVVITITDAEVSADIKEVRLYYNVFAGTDEGRKLEESILNLLNSSQSNSLHKNSEKFRGNKRNMHEEGLLSEILHRISRDVSMKTLPKNIHFIRDYAVSNIKNFEVILKSEKEDIYKDPSDK